MPGAGDAFEFVFALVAKDEVRAGEEVGDGTRHEDLVGPGMGADALADVHRDPSHVVVLEFDFTTVETGADLESEGVDLVTDRARAANRPGGTVESGQHTVTGGVHDAAPTTGDLPIHQCVMAGEEFAPDPVPQGGGVAGGVDDVGEQHGGQHPVVLDLGEASGQNSSTRSSTSTLSAENCNESPPGTSRLVAPAMWSAT